MNRVPLNTELSLSKVILGLWRLKDWSLSKVELLKLIGDSIEIGITSFDHADIYGNYECEALFGEALALKPALRKEIELISKCGIMLVTDKNPNRTVKHYDYSKAHIISSVNQSLKNLGTDYLDVLLLHRPSPFMNAAEIAEAFETLKKEGKVRAFGVSNFNAMQFELLDSFLSDKLVTNQIEISASCLEHFDNNNLDFLQRKKIAPMAWSPLGGGKIFSPNDDKAYATLQAVQKVADELSVVELDKILYAWLYMHPSNIMPIAGSGKIERLKNAVEALEIKMSLEQWFSIFIATRGSAMP